MEQLTKFKIAELSSQLNNLIEKTNKILEKSGNHELKDRLSYDLKELSNRSDFKLAFVGQYSSGKSTIISALTGNKGIKIDANVATDKVSEYRWNNILLVDTPGILAGKVEKHDELTKEVLKTCDLIVYVLTSSLFDDIMFENFIDLAYNQQFKDKMLIAVNKMSLEDGELEELKENYMESIQTTFKEKNFEFDFEIVFIDAVDYINGKEMNDEEFIQLSNFNDFINNLNSFVDSKGLINKMFDTPIRLLKSNTGSILLEEINPIVDDLIKPFENRLLRFKRDLEFDITAILDEYQFNYCNELSDLKEVIFNEDADTKIEKFDSDKSTELLAVVKKIESIIESKNDDLFDEFEDLKNKDSICIMIKSLKLDSVKVDNNESGSKKLVGKEEVNKLLDLLGVGSDEILKRSLREGAKAGGLLRPSDVSGSPLHKFVYKAGKTLNIKFKPWGAVNASKNIAIGAKVAGPLLSVAMTGLDVYNKIEEDKRLEKMLNLKKQFYINGKKQILLQRKEIEKDVSNYIQSFYGEILDNINKQKIEIAKTNDERTKLSDYLFNLDSEYVDFIEKINN